MSASTASNLKDEVHFRLVRIINDELRYPEGSTLNLIITDNGFVLGLPLEPLPESSMGWPCETALGVLLVALPTQLDPAAEHHSISPWSCISVLPALQRTIG